MYSQTQWEADQEERYNRLYREEEEEERDEWGEDEEFTNNYWRREDA